MKPIKSNDVRLGNLVQDRNGFIMRVVSIHEDGTVYCDFEGNEGDVWEFDNTNPCYPIPLTEEILLKFGFEEYKLNDDLGYNLKKEVYGILFKYDVYNSEAGVYVNHQFISVKYLHQLQNLYFALTGEELEVNL